MKILLLVLLVVPASFAAYIRLPVEMEDAEMPEGPLHDILAQAACTGLNTAGGWVYAVRRRCAAGSPLCSDICVSTGLKGQDSQVSAKSPSCVNSLHVYKNRPKLDPDNTKDTEKLGLKVYRYNSCTWASCGPNYCCCRYM